MSRFVQKIFAIKSRSRQKPNKCKSFLAPIFSGRTTPNFLQQIVSAIYYPPFGTAWLSSVCWCLSAKPGNEVERTIYVVWVKCRSKFMLFYQSYWHSSAFIFSFTVNDVNNCVLCVLMLCTFYFDVVTAVCQLLINGHVMLCHFSCKNEGARNFYICSVFWRLRDWMANIL